MRKISFDQARNQYTHRYTMEHTPQWANRPAPNGKFYAPQYQTDKEWYENTIFPGEGQIGSRERYCQSNNQSWPCGDWLDNPYSSLK